MLTSLAALTPQALSESDNEWKLTAAWATRITPAVARHSRFLNTHILPGDRSRISKDASSGLGRFGKGFAREKSNTCLQQDMAVHMNYNEVMQQVEKNPIPVEMGGDFLLNPAIHGDARQVYSSRRHLGEFLQAAVKGAAQDPRWANMFKAIHSDFQNQQMVLQKAQLAMQQSMVPQQMMQQQAMAQQGIQTDESGNPVQPGEGDDTFKAEMTKRVTQIRVTGESNPQSGDSNPAPEQTSKAEKPIDQVKDISDKNRNWAAINYSVLEKTIKTNHDMISKQLLKRHQELVDQHMSQWKKASKKTVDDIARSLKEKKKEG